MKNTHSRFTIAYLAGAPGSGKSYMMSLDVVDRLITSDTKIITNLPLNLDKVAERVARKTGDDPEAIKSRIKLLSNDDLHAWRREEGGPWELESEAVGSELILDECHLFCPAKGGLFKDWEAWLGEARHEGWRRIVFLTQDDGKVGKPIKEHSELRYELTSTERLRDPLFKIPLSSWQEIAASFSGSYASTVILDEYRRTGGRLKRSYRERFTLEAENFELYTSFSKPGGGSNEGENPAPIHEYEKRNSVTWHKDDKGKRVAPVWAWFLSRHHFSLYLPTLVISCLFWACFLGGFNYMMTSFTNTVQTHAAPTETQTAEEEPFVFDPEAIVTALPQEMQAALRAHLASSAIASRQKDERIDELQEEIAELMGAEMVKAQLTGIEGNKTYWSSGEILRVGESFEDDKLTKIRGIDSETRRVVIGTKPVRVVRLGGLFNYRKAADQRSPGLAKPLRTPPRVATSEAKDEGRRDHSILVRRSDADSTVRPDFVGQDGHLDHLREEFRQRNNHDGNQEATGPSTVSSDSQAAQHDPQSGGQSLLPGREPGRRPWSPSAPRPPIESARLNGSPSDLRK